MTGCSFCAAPLDAHEDGCAWLLPGAEHAAMIRIPQPVHQLTLNQRLHWADKGRTVKAWRYAAAWCAVQFAPRPWPASLVAVSLEVRGAGRRDPHNWFPTVKPIIDGLVDAGVWPDDTPQWVTTLEPRLVPVRRERWQPLFCTVVLIPRKASDGSPPHAVA